MNDTTCLAIVNILIIWVTLLFVTEILDDLQFLRMDTALSSCNDTISSSQMITNQSCPTKFFPWVFVHHFNICKTILSKTQS